LARAERYRLRRSCDRTTKTTLQEIAFAELLQRRPARVGFRAAPAAKVVIAIVEVLLKLLGDARFVRRREAEPGETVADIASPVRHVQLRRRVRSRARTRPSSFGGPRAGVCPRP